MASMVINTKAGSVELAEKAILAVTKEELKLNLQSAQSFLTRIQAKVEQMNLNSEQGRNDWNKAFVAFEAQIPKALVPEVKRELEKGLARIKSLMKPEKTWDLLQEIYCALNYTVHNLEKSYS